MILVTDNYIRRWGLEDDVYDLVSVNRIVHKIPMNTSPAQVNLS